MAQFNYTLPSGATFTMEAPAGTTQAQADYTFYSQVAAGALVGFQPGQSITGTSSALAKFNLSRLDRGIAGVDDTVILSIINGLPTVAGIPSLVNVPLENPVTQANIAAIAGTGFTAPAIGPLTTMQVQALMAQVANTVDQPANVATDQTGVGQYGFSCQQLEMAGFVKPGTWQQFLQNGTSNLIDVLNAPGIWTGRDGIYSLSDFLNNINAQNDAQAILMNNGYSSLQAAGVITTPATQSVSTVVGEVYTGSNPALTTATTTLTNTVNSQVAALVTNSSQYGTQLTAQWANGLPPVTDLTSNLNNINGLGTVALSAIPGLGTLTSGITPTLASVQTAMNVLGKASQFASTTASTLSTGLSNLSNINLSNISLSSITANLPSASSLLGQAQGAIAGQATALLNQAQGQASALLGQAQGQFNSLINNADSLVASVQKAAAFTNTVDRASVDVAFTKILGSGKISVPNFGTASSSSVGAALDISQAQSKLQALTNQGQSVLSGISSSSSQGFGSTLLG